MMMTDTNIRIENANDWLVDILTEYGAGEYAEAIAQLYIDRKWVKLDPNIGRYKFQYGELLDAAMIDAAIAVVTGE
jgi:hypothetical protein